MITTVRNHYLGANLSKRKFGDRNTKSAAELASEATTEKAIAPTGEFKDDPDLGPQEVYHNSVNGQINLGNLQQLQKIIVTYQGCAEKFRLCYPPLFKLINLKSLAISEPTAAIGESNALNKTTKADRCRPERIKA